MKKMFFFLILLQFVTLANAQITLNRSDYALQPDDTVFSRILVPETVAIPEEGADVIWDYTNVAFAQQVGNIENAGTHPDFPEANIVEMVDIQFISEISQETHFIEQLDDTGHRVLGREIFPRKSSLTPLTGAVGDSLNFLGGLCKYEQPSYLVKFPLNYQDTFSSNFTINTPFELTLPIVNFQQAPSLQTAYINYQYEVAGWGTITLPNPLVGGGQKSFDALLLKREQTRVDSFFINGEPASPLLLSFFFLAQGQTTISTNYTFWVKDLNRSALSISLNNELSQVVAASMSRDVNNFISTSTNFIDTPIAVHQFPNPVTDHFQLTFNKTDKEDWTFYLLDNLGREVYQQHISTPIRQVKIPITVPPNLGSGLYHFMIRNAQGLGVASDKVILK